MFLTKCKICANGTTLRTLQKHLMQNLHSSSLMAVRNGINEVDADVCLQDYKYVFQPDLLKDKVALVTGGGSGIGFRITELFMRHGCKTAIASRKFERVEDAAKKLKEATNIDCLPLQFNVKQSDQVEKVVSDVIKHYGKLDILVNNAAGNFICPAENLTYNGFKAVIDIDTIGTFNASKAAYEKYFKENGGNIINISATLAYRGMAFQTHAGCAKAAIDAMTKHLSVEWGSKGIRVNCIAPGPIRGTEGYQKLGGASNAFTEYYEKSIPLQRYGTKTEIAESTLYLASDISSYVTGSVLLVDGGSWLTYLNDPYLMQMLLEKKIVLT